jgi:putative Mg2+ transporter-C (MgtC) family protein
LIFTCRSGAPMVCLFWKGRLSLAIYSEDIIKLLVALAIGGMIGIERELRDKAAGFRTLMFICAGSALFTIFSIRLAEMPGSGVGADPTRIAAQIVSGIGFLGAGVIIREHGEVRGLTTAATIWVVAALGMGVGGGQYLFSVLAALIIWLILWFFPSLEGMMGTIHQVRTYQVTMPLNKAKHEEIQLKIKQLGLHLNSTRRVRHGDEMVCTYSVTGRPSNHEKLEDFLFENPDVREVEG